MFSYFLCIFLIIHAHLYECFGSKLTIAEISPQPLWNSTYTDKLKHDLFQGYDKYARPMSHHNVTLVKLGLAVFYVDIDEFKSTLTIASWLKMDWHDDKLQWNKEDYGGLDVLRVGSHEVWQPDITLFNSATGNALDRPSIAQMLVYPSGEILWVPPIHLNSFCTLDFTYWPFENQICSLTFGSWTYDVNKINLSIYNTHKELELDDWIDNISEWEITNSKAVRQETFYPCCDEAYVDITFNITLKRKSPMFQAIVVTPAIVILILTLISFWFPPQAGEKIVLNGCTAIIICISLIYFSSKVPPLKDHTPLILFFYSSSLYLVCFSIIISVVVMYLSRIQRSRHLPWCIKNQLTGVLGMLLCLGDFGTQNLATPQTNSDQTAVAAEDQTVEGNQQIFTKTSGVQQDWVLFAYAINRISFLFYSCLFSIFAVMYSI